MAINFFSSHPWTSLFHIFSLLSFAALLPWLVGLAIWEAECSTAGLPLKDYLKVRASEPMVVILSLVFWVSWHSKSALCSVIRRRLDSICVANMHTAKMPFGSPIGQIWHDESVAFESLISDIGSDLRIGSKPSMRG
jgi:hypothetical protein